ncbi:MAG: zinc dependent phospholipase C family protein [Deltaproteobacteria bacterium]|nr:zinc dependent phospholipase C family protein [Deltaproteobacteria bacterium]
MLFVYGLAIGLLFVCLPSDAFAWGPGMHLDIALTMLEKTALVAPAIRALMKAFPTDFLYGAVSPDIFIRKKMVGPLHHCHNWRMGMLLLTEAQTDRQRAAAYGYLAHLAADVVAHNYFIPYKIVRSFTARLLSHAYWELRFDLTVSPHVWEAVPQILAGDYREFDTLLERVMKKTLFSFKTSKRIYYSILVLHRLRRLRGGLKVYARQSRWALHEERIAHYRRLVFHVVGEFLQKVERAPCCGGDPTGIARQAEAMALRKRIRQALQRGPLTGATAERLVRLCRDRLEAEMFAPTMQWPDVYDVMR